MGFSICLGFVLFFLVILPPCFVMGLNEENPLQLTLSARQPENDSDDRQTKTVVMLVHIAVPVARTLWSSFFDTFISMVMTIIRKKTASVHNFQSHLKNSKLYTFLCLQKEFIHYKIFFFSSDSTASTVAEFFKHV